MIYRNTHPQLLREGIRKVFADGYALVEKNLAAMYNVQTSTKAYETDYRLAQFGAATLTSEGANIDLQDTTHLYENQYNHLKYALGFKISDEMLDDDQYGQMRRLTAALLRSMSGTVQILAAIPYANAFTTSGYDSTTLCSDSHPIADGSTGDNKTTAALDALGLETALELFKRIKSEEGFYMDINPTALIVPPELEFTALRLLESMGYPTIDLAAEPTADTLGPNDINVLRRQGLKLVSNPYLTDTTDWFLRGNTGEEDGIMWFWRMKPDLKDYYEESSRSQCYNSAMRLSYGWSDWRGIVGSSV